MSSRETEVSPRSRREIRSVADVFRDIARRALGEFGSQFPVVEALEWVLPELDPDFSFDYRPAEEMGEEHGLTIPSQHTIRLREDVYERACDGHGRDRMTVAHEIGHYFLHDQPAFARRENKKKEPLPAYRSAEWQASCFGAELLIFPQGLTVHMTVEEVAILRGVSTKAAEYQLDQYRKEGLLQR